ncbi:MAG: type II secretion system F family protein [Planctomycetia bacterium]
MDPNILFMVLAGVGVAVLVAAVYFIGSDYAGAKTLDQRLDRLTNTSTPSLESAGILREPMFPDGGTGGLFEKLLPHLPDMTKFFEQADVKMRPSQFWGIAGGAGLAGFILPLFFGMPPYMSIFVGCVLGFGPYAYVAYLRSARLDKFGAQMCEALELVARAIRAGHSLAAGMHVVAEEMPMPISQEFGRVWEEQNLGLSIEDAMRNLSERVPNTDLKFFVTAVLIQRQTGGDLAEILDKIGYLIRERFKILGLVKALTGEGRLSGVILIALPFVLLGVLMTINYDYVADLWRTPMGRQMSVGGLVMMVIGAICIRKICDIKV